MSDFLLVLGAVLVIGILAVVAVFVTFWLMLLFGNNENLK